MSKNIRKVTAQRVRNPPVPIARAICVSNNNNTEPEIAVQALAEPDNENPFTTPPVMDSTSSNAVQLEAPTDLPEGYEVEAQVAGATYIAIVPVGGVKQGDLLIAHLKQEQQVASPSLDSSSSAAAQNDVVTIPAPSDLPGGYGLQVEVDGKTLLVTVPPQGIKKGETITTTVPVLRTSDEPPTSPPITANNSNNNNNNNNRAVLAQQQRQHTKTASSVPHEQAPVVASTNENDDDAARAAEDAGKRRRCIWITIAVAVGVIVLIAILVAASGDDDDGDDSEGSIRGSSGGSSSSSGGSKSTCQNCPYQSCGAKYDVWSDTWYYDCDYYTVYQCTPC